MIKLMEKKKNSVDSRKQSEWLELINNNQDAHSISQWNQHPAPQSHRCDYKLLNVCILVPLLLMGYSVIPTLDNERHYAVCTLKMNYSSITYPFQHLTLVIYSQNGICTHSQLQLLEKILSARELMSCVRDPYCVATVHWSLASHWVQQHAWSPKLPDNSTASIPQQAPLHTMHIPYRTFASKPAH